MNVVAGAVVITEVDVRASIQRVKDHAESIWDEWAWQVENQTWLVLGYASWNDMRRGEYGALDRISAPRAETPELVARFRGAGLTQQQTADTLGVNQGTVSRHDKPVYKPRGSNMQTHSDDADEALDHGQRVNTETGEVAAEPETPDNENVFDWEHSFRSFKVIGAFLTKNPSPAERERLARYLESLHRKATS